MSKKMYNAALRESGKPINPILIKMLDDELEKLLKYERRWDVLFPLITFFSFLLSGVFTCLFLYNVYTYLH